MTVGYYAIPAPISWKPKTEPWPFCRTCVRTLGLEIIVPITEDMSKHLRCRACRLRLPEWR